MRVVTALADMVFVGRVRDIDGVIHAWIEEFVPAAEGVGWFICEHKGSGVRLRRDNSFVDNPVDCMTCLVGDARRLS